ncbi:MAG: thioredoxin family protein [Myxococcales bacterium]|nr:thioredoxin family protein [Myxococcales bacterium]
MRHLLLLLAALALAACQRPQNEGGADKAPASQAAASQAASAAAPPSQAASQAAQTAKADAHGGHGGGRPDIKWAGPIPWKAYDEGLAEAKASGKAVCLVLYADWCPRCRELAPVFAQDDVVQASEGLVMVRADSDDKQPWMDRYAHLGSYVPRVFFLDPNGTVMSDVTASHPRYPYFYPAGQQALLVANMGKAKAAVAK